MWLLVMVLLVRLVCSFPTPATLSPRLVFSPFSKFTSFSFFTHLIWTLLTWLFIVCKIFIFMFFQFWKCSLVPHLFDCLFYQLYLSLYISYMIIRRKYDTRGLLGTKMNFKWVNWFQTILGAYKNMCLPVNFDELQWWSFMDLSFWWEVD